MLCPSNEFAKLFAMRKSLYMLLSILILAAFSACSDDDDDVEYLFDRESTELKVLRSCADAKDTSSCYRLQYHYPIQTEGLAYIHMWLDTTVVDDTSKSVSSKQIENATKSYKYPQGTSALYDTIDLTEMVAPYLKTYDSLQVALFCEYTDDDDEGSVQRVYLHFGDDIPPARVSIYDSVWTTGVMLEWFRPTDQTDFYSPSELSGPIVGYNLELYSPNKNEDLRNVKLMLTTPDGLDYEGNVYYKRHARIYSNNDSIWVGEVAHADNAKNYLRIAVIDGKGFNFDADSMNRYRLVIEGLKPESQYTIGISAWDSSGNSSGTEGTSTAENNQLFITTDSIAPLMPTKIWTLADTLFPGYARLDSNNRLRIFWSQSVDPKYSNHPITVDSVLHVPDTCWIKECYDTVASYIVEWYNSFEKKWEKYSYAGGEGRYSKMYALSGDTMKVSTKGTFVTDTVRWVSPGDTIILRIRSIDKSGFYSVALIDTIAVSPGKYAKDLECPEGFAAVSTGDTSFFCMEKLEHQVDSLFANNILHSEAKAACEAISASGFSVSLCKERDWELVCLSGGTLAYGVIEEENVDATEYLFSYCNVATNDSLSAKNISKRDKRCVNPMGIRDLPGQYQEWVLGRSEDTIAVVKGSSYKVFNGLDRESIALCTNHSTPYYTRLEWTTDSVYLYREGSKVDTVFVADTSRTLYKILTKKDFKDSLQFFTVKDSSGNVIGTDYAPYVEYKKGGDAWLKTLANGLIYEPSSIKVVFLTGEKVQYREAAAFYKSPTIGFRCCAYPE